MNIPLSTKNDLINMKKEHDFFVGIDSDGCVFDTMEIKQKKCFHPKIIEHWHLEKIEKYLREAAEFVNLYSKNRGRNRFPCLMDSIDILRDRPEVIKSGVKLPDFNDLRKWIKSGVPLSNKTLEDEIQQTHSRELQAVLDWSLDVNKLVAQTVKNVAPFPLAMESLKKIHTTADSIVVSQTPAEALIREWEENGIRQYPAVIAGQELGTKAEQLQMATQGKYQSSRILMIGDAPGDKNAAETIHALFYPINPGHEKESWKRFYNEAYAKFLSGEYSGKYMTRLIDEFESLLPETPPWQK